MTEQTYWGWAIGGYDGLTSIMDKLVAEGTKPEPGHVAKLDEHAARLAAHVKTLKDRAAKDRR